MNFSGVHQTAKDGTCKALIDGLFPVKMTYLEFLVRKIKSIGIECCKKTGKKFDLPRDPIMIFVQTNELFYKQIIDTLVEKSFFDYQGIVVL